MNQRAIFATVAITPDQLVGGRRSVGAELDGDEVGYLVAKVAEIKRQR